MQKRNREGLGRRLLAPIAFSTLLGIAGATLIEGAANAADGTLASTGVYYVGVFLIAAIVLVAVGAGFMFLSRKRSNAGSGSGSSNDDVAADGEKGDARSSLESNDE